MDNNNINQLSLKELNEKYCGDLQRYVIKDSKTKMRISLAINRSIPTIEKYIKGKGNDLITMRALVQEYINLFAIK